MHFDRVKIIYTEVPFDEDHHSPFWMVFSPNQGPTSMQHRSKVEALAEAERLAKKHPGSIFYILRAEMGISTDQAPLKYIYLK